MTPRINPDVRRGDEVILTGSGLSAQEAIVPPGCTHCCSQQWSYSRIMLTPVRLWCLNGHHLQTELIGHDLSSGKRAMVPSTFTISQR